MNDTEFFSSNSYVFLPTKDNPKVALAVDRKDAVQNSFDLYNPFSKKAKLLKIIVRFGFKYFNCLFKIFFRVSKKQQSQFLKYLETKLNQNLIASVYFATTNDKVVIQLQSSNAEVIGYLKFPLNDTGLLHIKNEKRAIDALSSSKLVEPYIASDYFENRPFIVLNNLQGKIGLLPDDFVSEILVKFKRDEIYPLAEHPRIRNLKSCLSDHNLENYITLIDHICQSSTMNYCLVYEHGDFTPWNIIKVDNEYKPFDFEHFEEDGLEYLDLIKYYYQIGKLLKKKNGVQLVDFIMSNIDVPEFGLLFKIFLIKEIHRITVEGDSCDFEVKMLTNLELK